MEIEQVLNKDEKFRYQLLDRLRIDCIYYLGPGMRNTKYLWAGNAKDQVKYMKAIWKSFDKNGKPKWLQYGQIIKLEQLMNA